MAAPSIKQDTLVIIGLLLLGSAIALAGHYASRTVSQHMLMKHAAEAAGIWFRHLESIPDDVEKLANGKGASQTILDASKNLQHFTHIVRYEIYTPKGHLAYSSGKIQGASLPPLEGSFLLSGNLATGLDARATTHLFSSDDEHRPKHYAAVLTPLFKTGKHIGSILTYVDQTHQMKILSSAFGLIAGATVVLLLLAMSAPIVVLGFKIRDRWKAEAHIRYLAHFDPLSGLANRVTFNDKLTDALARRKRTGEKIAILFLDLDRFKEVNDTLGHALGDMLLVEFSKRLKACVRETDIISRLSGDEFAIALVDIQDVEQIRMSVDRIYDKMADPFELDGHAIICTVSIGIAVAPLDGEDTDGLLRCADMALYNAKDEGRNTSCFFQNEMDEVLKHRRKVENELRYAIEREEFELYFQPQFDLTSGAVTGNEALLRWNHPDHGLVSPAYFISVAEESGLIVPIGEWTIRTACKIAAGWRKPSNVAVNLSPIQFRRGSVVELVRSALNESGLDPRRLEIEITEAILMRDTEKALKEFEGLRALGVSIAMDDFGTGYSSLGYLSRFIFDKIKIDRTFIKDLESKETVRAIVSTIVALGRSLDIDIVAEGVETEEQAELLRQLHCGMVQGYLFGYPLPAHAHAKLIEHSTLPQDGTSQMQVA